MERGGSYDRRRRDSRDETSPKRDNKRQSRDNAPKRDTRDRSRSPLRRDNRGGNDRRRDRSPPRGPSRGGAYNSRGRDQQRPGDRGPPRQPYDSRTNNASRGKAPPPAPEKTMADAPPADEDEEAAMARLMGFKGFRSTKNTKVPGNDKNYGVNKRKKIEYRQYMNRVGGFNRPLSPSRG